MARYSSDSDSDRSSRHRRKHYRRSRSSSTDSSDSCSYKKRGSKHKTRRRHRTRSKSRDRDRPSKSYRSSRGNSKDRENRRRYRSKKSRSYSPEKNRRKGRSPSREKSSSRSSSVQSNIKPMIEKTIPSFPRDEFSIEPRIKESVLDEINADSFTPRAFSSSATSTENKFRNIVIDVTADTIQAPAVKNPTETTESIFHTSITTDREARFDRWVKKFYSLRQKAISDMAHANIT